MATSKRRFQDFRSADPEIQRVQEEARDGQAALQQPFMAGVHIIVPTIGAGADLQIAHKLGRAPRGWWVADAAGGPPLLHRTASDDKFITFHNSHTAAIGFAFWIY
jgi:hypothetical protein